ncbi:fumarate hydratase [Phaeovibrio sulfidiphilus]|uniref:Fumarate hydratase class I n=1 Tax=Phaeovibrio sulfidiphilus TaxID=1220600 RepID=A0A8J6YNW5_9PROT|nr:fumarate hydratase [Phaeovibrio sulfidiphilus]MBE1236836.1 fumarate hydratase [Phaeovibrio sulfidiphilus]
MIDPGFAEMFPLAPDTTEYRRLEEADGLVSTDTFRGQEMLVVEPRALTILAREAFHDISFFLRTGHLEQLRAIFDDPDASPNDRFVALELLKNANVAAAGVLPMCQDTGTAIIMGKKGQNVLSGSSDAVCLTQGVADAYTGLNLRYSQLAPLTMYDEVNTANNLPAQIDLYATAGNEYRFMFMAKGGGSANKVFLHQQTKALLNPDSLLRFVADNLDSLGTSACPPYHLAIVIGGTSAETCLKTVKLASARYLDGLPHAGSATGHAFRDLEMEQKILELTRTFGLGAQFGGKYYCHDVRVIRLPRHGASCPVGIGVSCSADRQALAKITPEGVFLEKLDRDPARLLPDVKTDTLSDDVVQIDLSRPMDEIRATLSRYPVRTRVSLSGPMIVARDIAHAKLKERLDRGEGLPEYFKNMAVYYAGPAKTPEGYASGSFGPTTAGRMDAYVDLFQSHGGSMVMIAKGNRSQMVTDACRKYGGFYLGSIGGAAAQLALESIRKVEVLEFPELGMEAIWKIEVKDFPAFIIVDDKGNDFFRQL